MGTSCSFPDVLHRALDAGHLDGISDVVQLAASAFVADPPLAERLAAQGTKLVANSVVRKRLAAASDELQASDVTAALQELRARCPAVDIVLAGTSDAARLRHFGTAALSLREGIEPATETESGGTVGGRLRVALAQLPVVPGDVEANLRTLEACVQRHAGKADLVVTPECFLSG